MTQLINSYNSNWILGGKGNMKVPRLKGGNLAEGVTILIVDRSLISVLLKAQIKKRSGPNMQETAQIRTTQGRERSSHHLHASPHVPH
jgi:hypothetical protein